MKNEEMEFTVDAEKIKLQQKARICDNCGVNEQVITAETQRPSVSHVPCSCRMLQVGSSDRPSNRSLVSRVVRYNHQKHPQIKRICSTTNEGFQLNKWLQVLASTYMVACSIRFCAATVEGIVSDDLWKLRGWESFSLHPTYHSNESSSVPFIPNFFPILANI